MSHLHDSLQISADCVFAWLSGKQLPDYLVKIQGNALNLLVLEFDISFNLFLDAFLYILSTGSVSQEALGCNLC